MKKLTVILPTKKTVVIHGLKRIWTDLDLKLSVHSGEAKYVLCYDDTKYKNYIVITSRNRHALDEICLSITKAYAEGKETLDLYNEK